MTQKDGIAGESAAQTADDDKNFDAIRDARDKALSVIDTTCEKVDAEIKTLLGQPVIDVPKIYSLNRQRDALADARIAIYQSATDAAFALPSVQAAINALENIASNLTATAKDLRDATAGLKAVAGGSAKGPATPAPTKAP